MKNHIILFALLILYACGSPQNKVSPKDTVKREHPPVHVETPDASSTLKNKITGIWTDGSTENATFDIKKDSIYYVDDFKSYKYSLVKDSIVIYYSDFTSKAKIYFLKDTLVMQSTDFGMDKFWRFKN